MTTDRAADLISRMQSAAQEVFIRQWHECRGSYDFADWFERAELTIKFYETHEWDGVRWQKTG
jgi:hypothetical protein